MRSPYTPPPKCSGPAKLVTGLTAYSSVINTYIAALHTSAGPPRPRNYHNFKVEKLSKQRQQELKKAKKGRLERETQDDLRHKPRQPSIIILKMRKHGEPNPTV
jgi:hypothetical protein